MNYILDTNVFIRYLLQDDVEKAKDVNNLFQKAREGRITLTVDLLIFAELHYALRAYYKLNKHDTCVNLKSILGFEFFIIPDRTFLSEAIHLYEHNGVDFFDALLFVKAKNSGEQKILSFDKGFDKLTPSLRVEP